jgi:plasmid stability protein
LVAPEPQDLPVFSEFAHNDANMKVWLPQVLSDRLDWISKQTDVSRPDVIRALMFEHLYGRVAYMALLAFDARAKSEQTLAQARTALTRKSGVERMTAGVERGFGEIICSRQRSSSIDAELIGKPTDNFRLELPRRLKGDLAEVARVHNLSASAYVRKMLVQQLCGERVHTNWRAAVGKIGRDVDILERDD